jgi:XRE family aerobic/anaerobic benzoate catabolism transcriptional regulator
VASRRLSTAPGGVAETTDKAAFLNALGERVRTLRARRGMTRRLLAQHSGVSERYIAQLEGGAGNVSVLLLREIARALGITPAALLEPDSDDTALLRATLARLSPAEAQQARALLVNQFTATADTRRQRVALVGLRGAGKSTLGRRLAEDRGVPFFELDREIESEAGLRIGEIVELHGQPGFRRFERHALERLLAPETPLVLTTGGGIVAEAATFDLLLRACTVVWVRASPEVHMRRVIAQGDLRPMAESRAAMDDLRAILASRESLYARADRTLDTTYATVEQSFTTLKGLLD